MAPSLKRSEIIQLIEWLDPEKAHKRLELIYSAQQHGCTPADFHRNCDKKGPCIAMAFNTEGYAWGGYAPLGFNQSGTWSSNAACFLFRIRGRNGESTGRNYTVLNDGAVYNSANSGPSFGTSSGHFDMVLMQGQPTRNATGSFDNTQGSIGNTGAFNFQEENGETICGDSFQLQDVQVYQVIDSQLLENDSPWRHFSHPWTIETLGKLKHEVAEYTPLKSVAVNQVRVLMLGPVGSGKSSFFNTINSAFYGYVTGQAPTGSAAHSLTTRYRMYEVHRGRGAVTMCFRLCDTMGLEEAYGIDITEIPHLLDGHVPDRYLFNPVAPISPDIPGFISGPELQDKIHVAAFVIDCSTVGVMQGDMLEKLRAVRMHINQRGIPLVILLTKIDQLAPEVHEDLSCVFHSMQVRGKVDDVAEKIGLPRSHVLPVKNYESEIELDVRVDILSLLAMRQMLRLADNYFDEQLDILLSQELKQKAIA